MVLLSLTLTASADTALLPVFFDLPGRTHWRLLQYSVSGSAVAVELIPRVELQTGTFVCNWILGQCDRMPPQVLLLFHDTRWLEMQA
jgi:hypothetical protein